MALLLVGCYIAFAVAFSLGLCWMWPDFVEEADPSQVRQVLCVIFWIMLFVELWVWWCGYTKTWTIGVMLLSQGWGIFDAILRFPVVHDLESWFTLKNALLTLLRIVVYILGFKDIT